MNREAREPRPTAIDPWLASLMIENALDYAIFTMDPDGEIQAWTPGAQNVLGYTAEEARAMDFAGIFVEADRRAGKPRAELDHAMKYGRAEDTRWHQRKDGSVFWANGVTFRLDEPLLLVKVMRDETRAKLAEDQRVLLLHELNHRIKNTLATVHSITDQSLRASDVDPAIRDSLAQRLIALGEAHNVLVEHSWAGADLRTIVQRAISPHEQASGERFDVSGPVVLLSSQHTVPMSLVLHELITNALKYGALSTPQGRVAISWNLAYDEVGARQLTLLWRESGGPRVSKPAREGFGTRLLSRSFEQAGGKARLTYDPEGLSCVIDLRLSAADELPIPPGSASVP